VQRSSFLIGRDHVLKVRLVEQLIVEGKQRELEVNLVVNRKPA
jgi:hypothetical protein